MQFYQELQDLADATPLRPIKLMVSDLLDVCDAADNVQSLATRLHPGFKVDEQQDAAEFMDFLFAVLDVCRQMTSAPNMPLSYISYNILQQVQCSCGYKSQRTSNDKTMKVAIDPDIIEATEGHITLTQLISSEFSESPTLDGFVCEHCHKGDLATISRFVTSVPNHLFIQLKRFRHDDTGGRKVEELVDFPMLLDILPIVHTSHRGRTSTTYDCVSIVEHIGHTLGVGHYIMLQHQDST